MASLADLKDQLSCLAIKYTEGFPHNWPEIRKTISRDPEKFYDSGGWSFLESQNPDDLHSRGVDVGGDGDGDGDGDVPAELIMKRRRGVEQMTKNLSSSQITPLADSSC